MAEEIQREIQRMAMDSSSGKKIDTDLQQNRLYEDHLLKLKIEEDKNAKYLQELKAKLCAKKRELCGLQEKIKSRVNQISELMDIRDKFDIELEDEEELL